MAEVKFTDLALKDLEDIATFISRESFHFASLQIQKIFQRTDILENFPFIGRVVPELKIKSVREIIEGNYRIIYRVLSKEEIHVLTIHHSSRRLPKNYFKKISKKEK
jgi:toxin ParE1/3/4